MSRGRQVAAHREAHRQAPKEMREKGTVARSTELGVVGQPPRGGVAAAVVGGAGGQSHQQLLPRTPPRPWPTRAVGTARRRCSAPGLLDRGLAALPILLRRWRRGGGDRRRPGRTPLHAEGPAVPVLAHHPAKAGLSRLFSAQGSWTLGKTLLKMARARHCGLPHPARADARRCSAGLHPPAARRPWRPPRRPWSTSCATSGCSPS